ncbi:hypothetical protein [Paraburkholderia acidiphila]|uniref:Uncharacterized protein n=1 Tax=Paraburkholderia acidiphila TaxID=2571747 RepID=A0A7Z2G8U0_9BURK|nr:hypothetical protein [Paraburkholderia acidiphila]QGZ57179.1 hypothetical protein FAZ97_19830 [Paraburkholderia acidiphila]
MNCDALPILIRREHMRSIDTEQAVLLVGVELSDALLTLLARVSESTAEAVAIAQLHDGYCNTLIASIDGSAWRRYG